MTAKSTYARVFRSELQRIIVTQGRKQSWLAERATELLREQTRDPSAVLTESRLSYIVNGLPLAPDDPRRAAIAGALELPVERVFPEGQVAAA